MLKHFSLIGNIIKSNDLKRVFGNFGLLSLIQAGNYILPLISLPYLVRILEPEAFGQLMFAQAFVQYFILIIDYGFNYSATREIALNKVDDSKISIIFCSVMLIKSILFSISLIILIVIVFTIDRFFSFRIIYFLSFASALGNLLFPNWLFQGLERMKYITLVNISSKFISTVSVFFLVTNPHHLLRVPIINLVASILPSLISLIYLNKIVSIRLKVPSLDDLKQEFQNGWKVFLSSISSSLYSTTNTFLIGVLLNNSFAGYYSFAEKILRAFTSFLAPLNGALFPFMSLKMNESKQEALNLFRFLLKITLVITSLGSLAIFFSSGLIIQLINQKFYPSISVLKILSPLVVIISVSNLIGFQILYTTGRENKFLLSVFIAGMLNLFFCVLLLPIWSYNSAAVSLLISETFVCFSFIYYARDKLFNLR